MSNAPALQQEIERLRNYVKVLATELSQIRRNIDDNKRSIQNLPPDAQQPLIRANLDLQPILRQKEAEFESLQLAIINKQKVVDKTVEIERKKQEIYNYTQELNRYERLVATARDSLEQLERQLQDITLPPPMPSKAELVFEGGQSIELSAQKPELRIGLKDVANNLIPDIDLAQFNGSTMGVSRTHASISFINGQWMIKDLNSVNGTSVNSQRLQPHQPFPLTDLARIEFGRLIVTFRQSAPTRTVRLDMPV
ncbi:MAG: FHA domain-containing protein [Chloroflexi bacterium]|nr:FHA domain-containing protein [Chloroflexota bacterium]